jgi:hypothetical protein
LASVHTLLVAILKVQTGWPEGVVLVSGAETSLPIKNTLFRFMLLT